MKRIRKSTVLRREEIVNAARKLVIRLGSEHVTVRRIADEVGFTEAAVYRHFKSKKEILLLLIENIEFGLLDDLTAPKKETAKIEHLETVLRRHLSSVERRQGVSFQVIAEIISLGDKKLNKQISRTLDKYLARLSAIIQDGVDSGEFRQDLSVEAAALMLFGTIQGLANLWTLSSYQFNPQERFQRILQMLRPCLLHQS